MTKFCKDCKYGHSVWCKHPSNGIDLVTGETKVKFSHQMRGYADKCDEEGKLWEPRPELPAKPAGPEPRLVRPWPEVVRPWWKFWR